MAKAEARTTPSEQRSWKGWLAAMPERVRVWPFPVSATGQGFVHNVAPAKVKKPRGKPPGSIVRLYVVKDGGDVPPAGVVLLLSSGRRYRVAQQIGGRFIDCVVMSPDDSIDDELAAGKVWPWRWASRRGVLQRAAA